MNTPTKPTFHAHGKDWFPHTLGDPMPCDGETKVFTRQRYEVERDQCINMAGPALLWLWQSTDENAVIGWRYADPQPESVPDELARLREEVANMRTAIRDAQFALAYYSSCIENNVAHDVIGVFTAENALAKLQPFTHP